MAKLKEKNQALSSELKATKEELKASKEELKTYIDKFMQEKDRIIEVIRLGVVSDVMN